MFGNAFGQSTNTASAPGTTTTGGLFGSSSTGVKRSSGFSFGGASSTPTPTIAPTANLFGNTTGAAPSSTGGLFGAAQPAATSGGLFGNSSNNTASAPGGLFGNNNNAAAAAAAPAASTTGGLFGSRPAGTTTGGLFGNSSTTTTTAPSTTGGLFGNNNNSSTTGGGLFGAKPAVTSTTGGLFGNTANSQPAPSGGLFGNTTQTNTGGLFGSSNVPALQQQQQLQPQQQQQQQQFNVKDLPKSITESVKAKPSTAFAATHSRKRSLSTSGNALNNELIKSTIITKLSSTFNSSGNSSMINYSSEGLFSPRNDVISSSLSSLGSESSSKTKTTTTASSSSTSSQFASILKISNNRSNNASDYLKLKVDPSRSEAMKLKIFGEAGNARKIRILGPREDEAHEEPKLIEQKEEEKKKEQLIKEKEQDSETNDTIPVPTAEMSKEPQQNQKEDQKQDGPTNSPSIIKTAKDEYWCSPSISELSKYHLRQLSNVSNFAVGRKGYGTIWFQDPVDLSSFWGDLENTLFGNIVRFKNKTVEVYPEGSVPYGTGLNVPATITIEKLFPVIKSSSKKTISTTSSADDKDYQLRLFVKKLKDQREMEFITYDPINGNWTFKVKHFSVWGIVDEDTVVIDLDEIREEQQEQEQKQKQNVEDEAAMDVEPFTDLRKEPAVASTLEEQLLLKRQHRVQSFGDSIPGAFVFERPSTTVKKISPPVSASDSNTFEESNGSSPREITLAPSVNSNKQTEIEEEQPFEEIDEKDYEPLDVNDDDFANLDAEPQLETSDDWDIQLELAGKYNSAFGNTELFQSMTGGVGAVKTLSALNRILYEKELKETEEQDKMDEDSEEEVREEQQQAVTETEPLANRPLIEDLYQMHLEQVQIPANNSFPQIERNANFKFKSLLDCFKQVDDSNSTEYNIWRLASVLFDLIPQTSEISDPAISTRILDIKRREGVVAWLNSQLETELNIRYDSQNDQFEKIYTLIVQQKIPEACKLAIKTKNSHLAVFISLLGSNDPQVKESARAQLNDWKRNSVLHTIPRGIQKIYNLLAGDDFVLKEVDADDQDPLSWRSKLNLFLANGDLNQPLEVLLLGFIQNESSFKRKDLIFLDLLKLYVVKKSNDNDIDANAIFQISNSTTASEIRIKWYLFEILVRSTSQLNLPSHSHITTGDQLTEKLASQYEALELFEQSLFILLHHSNITKAQELITECLNRNINKLTDSEVDTALRTFHIPSTIIHTAKAKHFHGVSDFWSEATSLLDAETYDLAHDLIVKECSPEAVINNGKKLESLGALIERFPEGLPVKGWDTGLGIYKAYLKFLSDERDRSCLIHLLDHLSTIQVSTLKTNIAVQIMSKNVSKEVIRLNDEGEEEKEGNLELDIEKLWKLPLSKSDLMFFKTLVRGKSR